MTSSTTDSQPPTGTGPRRRRSIRTLGLAVAAGVVAALVLASCGDDGPSTGADVGGELPAPEVSVFTAGDFDEIRLPRGASEVSEKTERDGAIAQSFAVTATSPTNIMDYFARTLPEDGWDELEAPRPTGTETIDASWAKDGRRLDVSATVAQGLEDDRSQFSLVLLPSLESPAEIEGG